MRRSMLASAVLVSLLAHGGLLALVWVLGRSTERMLENDFGGVVWVNPDAGGLGSGGEGGFGAPQPLTRPAKAGHPLPVGEGITLPHRGRVPEGRERGPSVAPPLAGLAKFAPGIEGPGEGDTGGPKTGPGGGPGEGLGQGQGSGQGNGSGPGGLGPLGVGPGAGGDNVLARIKAKVLGAKRYPRAARQEGVEGVSLISFRLNPDGSVAELSLLKSSGSELLDDEALATVRRASPLPYYEGAIRLSLNFNLRE